MYNKVKALGAETVRQILNLIRRNSVALGYEGEVHESGKFFTDVRRVVDFLKYINYNNPDITYSLISAAVYDAVEEAFMGILDEDDKPVERQQKSSFDFYDDDDESEYETEQNEIFSGNKMAEAQPQVIRNPHYLQTNNASQLRDTLLTEQGLEKRDLNDAIATLQFYRDHPIPRQVKPKKEPYGEGMDAIAPQVLSGRRDIRRINDTQSVQGAQRWVEKHGFNDIYEVTNQDEDGDGIPDIIVKRTRDNHPIIVNGYTTVDSTYPYRHRYYTEFPTERERKLYGKGFKGFVEDIWEPEYDQKGLKIVSYGKGAQEEEFGRKIKEAGYKKILKPHDKNVYQVFVSKVIKPMYDTIKAGNNGTYPDSKKMAKVASNVWDKAFTTAAMVYVYGPEVLNQEEATWKKLKGNRKVKDAVERFATPYIINGRNKILEFFPVFCEAEGLQMDQQTLNGFYQILNRHLPQDPAPRQAAAA